MSDGFFLIFVQGYFMERPEKNDWKALLENLETLLEKCKDQEQERMIKQYILEFFADQIGDGKFDGMYIKRFLGPLTRAYMNEYEEFQRTNIRY